jgi:hypothetical protein
MHSYLVLVSWSGQVTVVVTASQSAAPSSAQLQIERHSLELPGETFTVNTRPHGTLNLPSARRGSVIFFLQFLTPEKISLQ